MRRVTVHRDVILTESHERNVPANGGTKMRSHCDGGSETAEETNERRVLSHRFRSEVDPPDSPGSASVKLLFIKSPGVSNQ